MRAPPTAADARAERLTPPRAIAAVCAVCVFLGAAPIASAQNPLNSSEASPLEGRTLKGRTDFTIVPAAGGSTDIGVGGGFFAALTRNKAGYAPYVWNVDAAGFITFLPKDGRFTIPFADIYSKVSIIRFLGGPLELDLRPSFTDEQALYYYGMGNDSASTLSGGLKSHFFEYGRVHPELLVDIRGKFLDHLAGKVGFRVIQTSYDISPGTKLAIDQATGSPEVKSLIGPTQPQGTVIFRYGLAFDTRDNRVKPHSGTFDEIIVGLAPGGTPDFPNRFGEASANLRAYVPLFSPRLTLAARLVGDSLFGDVPFFELSRAVDVYAIGGSNGVRGVPAQRYYGKVKIFGNLELRAKLFDFRLFGKAMTMGMAAFGDGGRVWADTKPEPALDGTTLNLKYGVGGGLRLMSGTAFVLRADVAWSPDATPIGVYVAGGEIF